MYVLYELTQECRYVLYEGTQECMCCMRAHRQVQSQVNVFFYGNNIDFFFSETSMKSMYCAAGVVKS